MCKSLRVVTNIVASLLATTAAAEVSYIPAAAHVGGVGGASWRSDVEVMAAGEAAATFTIELLERGRGNSSPAAVDFTLAVGSAARYRDLLGSAFVFEGSAALRITASNGALLITSRTYNDDPAGTFGQFIPALADSAAFASGDEVALIQLSRSAEVTTGYRTNIGYVNVTAAAIDVEVDLYSADGSFLGRLMDTLLPYEYEQITNVFAAVTSGDVDDGFAIVRTTTTGGRFFTYASVVDNRSADAVFIPGAALPGGASQRLTASDLSYRGGFRLPDAFDWGARGVTFHPSGGGGAGSLLVVGNDLLQAEFGEVSIPQPVVAADWLQLPEAALLTPMTDFGGAIVHSVDPDTAFASGIEVVPRQGSQDSDKLYGSVDQWYGVYEESHPTIWFAELDGSETRGPFHVGPEEEPFHGNKAGDYLFSVPQWYADLYLGGRTLVTGKTRGAFHGSQGPTLLAFQAWDSDSPSGDLDAVAMLWYRILYPECAGPNVGDPALCDYPAFTMCDKWEGGAFVERADRRAIILLGFKGLGTNHYGAPPFAGTCQSDQGYHCDPFERQVVFYDVDELGAVAQGERDPWTVVPYEVWRPQELFLGNDEGHTCGEVGGVTVDTAHGRVFMIEKGLGDNNAAVVHVWSVNSGG